MCVGKIAHFDKALVGALAAFYSLRIGVTNCQYVQCRWDFLLFAGKKHKLPYNAQSYQKAKPFRNSNYHNLICLSSAFYACANNKFSNPHMQIILLERVS